MRLPNCNFLLAMTLTLSGPGHSALAETTLPAFTTTIAADHPLSGKLFEVSSGKETAPYLLIKAMTKADFIFLGEKHDNPDHHAIQAWAYDALIAEGRTPALLYEMIGEDQQTDIDEFLQTDLAIDQLGDALNWETSGWPDWALYAPMARSARQNNLPILGANLAKNLTRKIYTDGPDVLGTDRAERLGLTKSAPDAITEAILDDVETGHCGLMPRDALGAMVMVQRTRDAVMADNVLKGGALAEGAVLITGNGHARKDHGVPWAIRQAVPEFSALSLAMIEVQDDQTSLEDYREIFGDSLPFDYVLFTPRANDRDYCAELKATMGGKKDN